MNTNPTLRWSSIRWQTALMTIGAIGVGWLLIAAAIHAVVPVGAANIPATDGGPKPPWSTNEIFLLGLGDSITAGFGATPKHGYFELLIANDDRLYPDMTGQELQRVFPHLAHTNLSVSGSISAEHLGKQVPRIPRMPLHVRGVVVITTGGNDLIHDYGRSQPRDGAMYGCTGAQAQVWKERFRKRLIQIIDGVNAKFPGGCEIFLANIFDPTDGIGDIQNANLPLPPWPDGLKALSFFNEVIADAARVHTNVHVVDFHTAFLGHGIHCTDSRNPHYRKDNPRYWYFENLEDPNDPGYDAIRRLFLVEMNKVFGDK